MDITTSTPPTALSAYQGCRGHNAPARARRRHPRPLREVRLGLYGRQHFVIAPVVPYWFIVATSPVFFFTCHHFLLM